MKWLLLIIKSTNVSSRDRMFIHERNGEILQFFADISNKEQEQKLNELIAQEVITEINDFSKHCRDFIADVNQRISKKKSTIKNEG